MHEITFTESEIAYIVYVLSKHYLEDEEIRKVLRLIAAHLPHEQTTV